MKHFICFTLLAMATPSFVSAAKWEVGKPFPSLVLPTVSGKETYGLSKFRGDKVMLHVFASW